MAVWSSCMAFPLEAKALALGSGRDHHPDLIKKGGFSMIDPAAPRSLSILEHSSALSPVHGLLASKNAGLRMTMSASDRPRNTDFRGWKDPGASRLSATRDFVELMPDQRHLEAKPEFLPQDFRPGLDKRCSIMEKQDKLRALPFAWHRSCAFFKIATSSPASRQSSYWFVTRSPENFSNSTHIQTDIQEFSLDPWVSPAGEHPFYILVYLAFAKSSLVTTRAKATVYEAKVTDQYHFTSTLFVDAERSGYIEFAIDTGALGTVIAGKDMNIVFGQGHEASDGEIIRLQVNGVDVRALVAYDSPCFVLGSNYFFAAKTRMLLDFSAGPDAEESWQIRLIDRPILETASIPRGATRGKILGGLPWLVVEIENGNTKIEVPAILDTGSPGVWLANSTLKSLGFTGQEISNTKGGYKSGLEVKMNQISTIALESAANSEFANLNLVGITFLADASAVGEIDYGSSSFWICRKQ
ncbi:hypothetical protein SELMODRAFT_422290 [Selaginella moellendorffii]|uniref:Uncharacterized protein n=1 Tax=Selaginella moellendorffii TaxID=88036 RepID=D8SIJ5_SELML|nr:hypothetical protein SELMODRAFT_422290 [Selaginella moellendorffii]